MYPTKPESLDTPLQNKLPLYTALIYIPVNNLLIINTLTDQYNHPIYTTYLRTSAGQYLEILLLCYYHQTM